MNKLQRLVVVSGIDTNIVTSVLFNYKHILQSPPLENHHFIYFKIYLSSVQIIHIFTGLIKRESALTNRCNDMSHHTWKLVMSSMFCYWIGSNIQWSKILDSICQAEKSLTTLCNVGNLEQISSTVLRKGLKPSL